VYLDFKYPGGAVINYLPHRNVAYFINNGYFVPKDLSKNGVKIEIEKTINSKGLKALEYSFDSSYVGFILGCLPGRRVLVRGMDFDFVFDFEIATNSIKNTRLIAGTAGERATWFGSTLILTSKASDRVEFGSNCQTPKKIRRPTHSKRDQ